MSSISSLGLYYVDGSRRLLNSLVEMAQLATEVATNSGCQLIRCLMDRTKLTHAKLDHNGYTVNSMDKDKNNDIAVAGKEVVVEEDDEDADEEGDDNDNDDDDDDEGEEEEEDVDEDEEEDEDEDEEQEQEEEEDEEENKDEDKESLNIPRPTQMASFGYPRLVSAVCGFAKDASLYPVYSRGKYGEDAWFKATTATADALGVADGVGGWRIYGVDPGEFSMFLMRSCERLALAPNFDPQRPDLLMARAYCDLMEQKHPVLGSSTACILTLRREDCMLYAANIGDSGFMIIRNGAIVCRSAEQQHYFNTPFQLSGPPPGHGLSVLADGPECADTMQFACMVGDVLLLATDGVYDNVPEDLLLDILNDVSGVSDAVQLQMSANCIALMARTLSFNPNHDSPFSQNARRQDIVAPGGKPDDITVVLASII